MPEVRAKGFGRRKFLRQCRGVPDLLVRHPFSRAATARVASRNAHPGGARAPCPETRSPVPRESADPDLNPDAVIRSSREPEGSPDPLPEKSVEKSAVSAPPARESGKGDEEDELLLPPSPIFGVDLNCFGCSRGSDLCRRDPFRSARDHLRTYRPRQGAPQSSTTGSRSHSRGDRADDRLCQPVHDNPRPPCHGLLWRSDQRGDRADS